MAGGFAGRVSRRQRPVLRRTGGVRLQPRLFPVAIALEAIGLVVSPYTNPFYTDALAPIVADAFPPEDLAVLNAAADPRLFITATDVSSNGRAIFSQPDISVESLRASGCLPTDFKTVTISGVPYWDGGYLGNPSLAPLLDFAQDLLLVLVNPFHRDNMPPVTAPGILDRLNEITFNASVVLEVNAIEAVNSLLAELAASGVPYGGRYKPIRIHAIRSPASWKGLASFRRTARRGACCPPCATRATRRRTHGLPRIWARWGSGHRSMSRRADASGDAGPAAGWGRRVRPFELAVRNVI